MEHKYLKIMVVVLISFWLIGCTQPRPDNIENICSIFDQYPDWYWDAKKAQDKWGVSIPTQMAIIYQESGFSARAKPPRRKLLWIIPWKRQSSAYGYSQALKHTWEDYERQTGNDAGRHEFDAATDFIGWYSKQASQRCGMPLNNTYALYLAYHEGPSGYQKRSYFNKPWLIKVAKKVADRADVYQRQLQGCEKNIEKPSGWWFW